MDGIRDRAINYQSLDPKEVELNGSRVALINSILSGQLRAYEEVVLSDQRQFVHEWRSVQRRRIEAHYVLQGRMPWEKFSPDNLKWYAKRLAPESTKPARAIIHHDLFDGRETFEKDEIFQAILLFGKEAEIRRIISRNIIDIRSPGGGASRGAILLESRKNIIQTLRACVDVFARTLKMSDASLDSLNNTSGTPDYIAMREALINQIIHQDYQDASAPAQIIIAHESVTFFNVGYSLIPTDSLIQGWKTHPRNPLIARALRLIGFADLRGSGLQELQRVWRTANQRPPTFTSNKDENNFTLVLDWRPVKNAYDEFWKTTIGVSLSPEQAQILNLTADPSGITLEQGVSGSGLSFESTRTIFQYLMTQALIEQREGRYYVKEHLRQLLGDAM
jgi:predicted HTH transcriptional regulator